MALSRKARVWLIVACIPVVLIVGAVAALKMYFTSERLKGLIIPRIEQATHRSVAINDINLSVLPSIGVDLNGFSLSNMKGEGFSSAPFLSLDRLTLNLKLLPLLNGKAEVTSMVLEQPKFLIETNKAGVPNYADLKQKPAVAPASAPAGTAPPPGKPSPPAPQEEQKASGAALLLSNFRIINGAVDYVDYKQNSAMRVQGLNSTMSADVSSGEARVEGQASVDQFSYGTVTTPLISNLRLTLDHRLVYAMNQDVLTVEKGDLTVQDMALKIAGKVTEVTKAMRLDLTISSDHLNITDLLSLVPKEYMKKAEGLKGNGTAQVALAITGTVTDSTQADIAGKVSSTNASIQYAQLPKPITNVNIVAEFTRAKTKQEFKLEKFSANLGENTVAATMDVMNFEDPSLTMTVNGSLNLGDVGQYYPLEQGTELAGKMSANVNLAGKVKNPAAIKAAGTMEFQDVTIKTPASPNPVQHLQGAITFNNQRIEAKKISMTLGKSDLALAFAMNNYMAMVSEDKSLPRPAANLTLTSNHLYTADVMPAEKPKGAQQPAGGTPKEAAPKQSAQPQPEQPAAQQPAAKPAAAPARSGVPLPNVDMTVAASIGTLTMEKFEFSNVKANMHIADGVINMQNFSLNAFGGSVTTKGTLNMKEPKQPQFDLSMDMKGVDSRDLLSRFTSFGQRLAGKLAMTTALKGSLNDTLGLNPKTLNGQGHVQVADGSLTGVKINQTIASLLKLPDLENITFKDWSNSFTVADGRIVIKDLKINALDANYTVNGSQGLDGTLDYTMTMLLSDKASARVNLPGVAGQAADLLKDPSGRMKLDFAVGGTTDDPKVSLDTKAVQQKAEDLAKQKVATEAKKAEDQLKKKAEDALKGLFKRK